ncbi:TetR/AcrR family transcriptional regulator [Deinococcus ruber]|uniref:TetR/AcrR family transcriptional regulator n=1 Tax=Deinococcus ruber TaxID=1848197 RepID=UPI0016689C52|nr:TetR/AcrR family transcriptional regulator [Deinococcus ruber]
MTKTRTRNRRGEGVRLRQDILAAAADLLDRGGEAAVTLREIALTVGISAPSIYAHFTDREAVVAALVSETFDLMESDLRAAMEQAGPDPVTRLRALAAAYLDFAVRWPQRYRVLFGGLWSDRTVQPNVVANSTSRMGHSAFGVLLEAVDACQRAGAASDTDPFSDAAGLWAALHGLAQLSAVAPLFPWPAGLLDQLVSRLALLRS